MIVQIDYDEPVEFLGRNGAYKMAGIIMARDESEITLSPITSKGNVGRAFLTIPHAYVQQVAQALLRLSQK